MNARNQGTRLRRIVAQRLDSFFAAWIQQLGAGTTALWQRVERRLAGSSPSEVADEDAAAVMHVPMQQQAPQQQPVQQQQLRKRDDEQA